MVCRSVNAEFINLRAFRPGLHFRLCEWNARSFACGATPKDKQMLQKQLEYFQRNEKSREQLSSSLRKSAPRFEGNVDRKILEVDEDMESWSIDADDDEDEIFKLGTEKSSPGTAVADYGWGVEDLNDEVDDEEWAVSTAVGADSSKQKAAPTPHEERNERWRESPAMRGLPRHVLNTLHGYQDEADTLNKEISREKQRRKDAESKLHRRLRVITGDIAGRRLLSGRGEATRPMMEKVRAAAFDMLQARCGSVARLPEGSKWLDLFAGTGSVGLEALSRGVQHCCFIELDRWVVDTVLMPNLSSCSMIQQSVVHTMRAEDFLTRAKSNPEYYAAFDFISVCPPYLKVSYEELFGLLEGSPLLHPETHVIVEYPRKSKSAIPTAIGPLSLIKDRKFGRTNLAVFGPA